MFDLRKIFDLRKFFAVPKDFLKSKIYCSNYYPPILSCTVLNYLYSDICSFFQYHINETEVDDKPRFSYRGVMLDSSRHFLSMKVLIDNLDLMEMNKMNAFHWHLTGRPGAKNLGPHYDNWIFYTFCGLTGTKSQYLTLAPTKIDIPPRAGSKFTQVPIY